MKWGERTKLIKKYSKMKKKSAEILYFKELEVLGFFYRIENKWVSQMLVGKLKTNDISFLDRLKIVWLILKPNFISYTTTQIDKKVVK